jgi:hypothetical protein
MMHYDDDVSDYKNQTYVDCNYSTKPEDGKVCAVNVDAWDPCTSDKNFDYVNSRPCIFIKLNKVGLLFNFCNNSKKCYYIIS